LNLCSDFGKEFLRAEIVRAPNNGADWPPAAPCPDLLPQVNMDKTHEILESIIEGADPFVVRGILPEGAPESLTEP